MEDARFDQLEVAGRGAFGTVYKMRVRTTGELLALKVVNLESEDEGTPATIIREVSILKALNHPNIVRLYEAKNNGSEMRMLFEWCQHDVKYLVNNNKNGLPMQTVKSLTFQLVCGLAYIHHKRVLHRDLKPQNLLMKDDVLKVADFGLACGVGVPVRTHTLWYRPPDVLLGSTTYDTSVDMWSAGCIFAELCTGRPTFTGNSESDQLKKIFAIMGSPSVSTWPEVAQLPDYRPDSNPAPPKPLHIVVPTLDAAGLDLLAGMLHLNPSRRISAAQALQHPFFADLGADFKQRFTPVLN